MAVSKELVSAICISIGTSLIAAIVFTFTVWLLRIQMGHWHYRKLKGVYLGYAINERRRQSKAEISRKSFHSPVFSIELFHGGGPGAQNLTTKWSGDIFMAGYPEYTGTIVWRYEAPDDTIVPHFGFKRCSYDPASNWLYLVGEPEYGFRLEVLKPLTDANKSALSNEHPTRRSKPIPD